MTTEPTPDEIRRATFRVVFRGYEQSEVEERLAALAELVGDLNEQRDRLASRLGEYADRDLKTEFEVVGREVASVLEAARAAAETMRDRAGADAARWRSEAMAEVETLRKQARTDAEALRTDAWTTSSQLLEQVMAEVERHRAGAERDALAVMGESEREAHRLTSTARREAEEVVRAAKMEAERLVAQARADHDDIIATAQRQAEAAQERTRALEQRRQELMAELEALRATLASFESELEDRRQGIGLSEPTELPTRAVVADAHGVHLEEDWEEGHTVRVIRPSREEAPAETDADAIADEVARMRESSPDEAGAEAEAGAEGVEEPTPPEPIPVEVTPVEVTPVEVTPVEATPVEDEMPETVAPPAPASPVSPPPAATSEPDEVLELFRRLRRPGEPAAPAAEPDEGPAPAPEPPPRVEDRAEDGLDPFETRDRLLLPITNEALRAVKRALTEVQNQALEQIRLGRWEAQEEVFEDMLHEDLVALSEEAALAGAEAATELGVAGAPSVSPRAPSPPEMGHDLAEALRTALTAAGAGSRERQAAASRVFRGWRTDEAERRLRSLALSSYHSALRQVLDSHGRQWRWRSAGRMCAACRAAAEAGHQLPPVHRDCDCTIVPA